MRDRGTEMQDRGTGGRAESRDDFEKGLQFGFAVGAETGGDLVKIAVVVAGVADEFPDAGGELMEDLEKGRGVETTCGGDAQGAVGCEDGGVHR